MDPMFVRSDVRFLSNYEDQEKKLIEYTKLIENGENKDLQIIDNVIYNPFQYINYNFNTKTAFELSNLENLIDFMKIDPSFNILLDYTDITSDNFGFIEFLQKITSCVEGYGIQINLKFPNYLNRYTYNLYYDKNLEGDLRNNYENFMNHITSHTQVGTSLSFASTIKEENSQIREDIDIQLQLLVGVYCCRYTKELTQHSILGGNFILKINNIRKWKKELYLISLCFELFKISKPASLDIFNDHLYIVFINKKPKSESHIYINELKEYIEEERDIDVEDYFEDIIQYGENLIEINKYIILDNYNKEIIYDTDVALNIWRSF